MIMPTSPSQQTAASRVRNAALHGLSTCADAGIQIPTKKIYGESMKKAILSLLFAFAVAHCAENAQAAPGDSGSTTGWQDNSVNQSLAEEFAKCSAFNVIAAECVKKNAQKYSENVAARHEDNAKRFYRGGYMLAGQDFTQKRLQFHDTSMRRSAGSMCEGFSKLEQQYRRRCDDTFKRLPRTLQRTQGQ
jgi:hypothetical protein